MHVAAPCHPEGSGSCSHPCHGVQGLYPRAWVAQALGVGCCAGHGQEPLCARNPPRVSGPRTAPRRSQPAQQCGCPPRPAQAVQGCPELCCPPYLLGFGGPTLSGASSGSQAHGHPPSSAPAAHSLVHVRLLSPGAAFLGQGVHWVDLPGRVAAAWQGFYMGVCHRRRFQPTSSKGQPGEHRQRAVALGTAPPQGLAGSQRSPPPPSTPPSVP